MLILIRITVELHGLLAERKPKHRQLTFTEPVTLVALLEHLDLSRELVGMLVVNGKVSGGDIILKDGDCVYLAPHVLGG